jgi:hypothetical protein
LFKNTLKIIITNKKQIMKIVLRIFGILAVIVAVGMGTLGVVRNFRDAADAKEFEASLGETQKEITQLKEQVKQATGEEADYINEQIKDAEDVLSQMPSSGAFTFAGILVGALALVSLVSAVFLFKKGQKKAVIILGATVVLSLLAIVISPDIDGGLTGGMSNRSIAYIVSVPAVLVALFAFLLRGNTQQPAKA